MENPGKVDDLGVPLFQETPISCSMASYNHSKDFCIAVYLYPTDLFPAVLMVLLSACSLLLPDVQATSSGVATA